MLNINDLSVRVLSSRDRSAWAGGVTAYAADLLEALKEGIDSESIDAAALEYSLTAGLLGYARKNFIAGSYAEVGAAFPKGAA